MSSRGRLVLVASLALALCLSLLGPIGAARAQSPAPVAAALSWLRSQQAADGTFGSSTAATIEATLAAAAAGEDIATWRATGGASLADALGAAADAYATDGATTGKLLTAAVAAGLDPRALGGIDLVARLQSYGEKGAFSDTALGQAWAILGLGAASEVIPPGAVERLVSFQQPGGGWEGGPGWGVDSNTTALAVQALISAGVPKTSPALVAAADYLSRQVAPAGGMVYSSDWGDAADANSTAYGIQALRALGLDPDGAAWSRAGRTQTQALVGFQIAGGALEWQPGQGANLMATAQAVPALMGVVYPVRPSDDAAPEPVALGAGQPETGVLVGNRAGAHALYRVAHPGAGREVAIVVATPRAHPLILVGFGFDVYDEAGRRLGGGRLTPDTTEHVLRFARTSATPAVWTVQVYHYVEGTTLPFRIAVDGLDTADAGEAPSGG